VNEGVSTALVGNNGCGKTTTILIMGNIISYDSGNYFFKNNLVTPRNISFKRQIGMILSNPYYIEDFNVMTYWRFVAKFQGVDKNEIGKRINDLLLLLEIDEPNLRIGQLSKGNQAKVTIGSALIHNPQILLLDEPFINLDINTQETFRKILFQLKGKKTLFITSHNLDLVADLCDNFLIMDNGKIISEVQKSEYPNTESLKEYIKQKLSGDERKIDLQWLQ
jgi:ABC-2 type transport system ATP-binding protein